MSGLSDSAADEVRKRDAEKWIDGPIGDANRMLNRVQIVPLTANVDRLHPGEARVTLNGEPRKAMADQIATASKVRLRDRVGELSAPDLTALERAMRVQLRPKDR